MRLRRLFKRGLRIASIAVLVASSAAVYAGTIRAEQAADHVGEVMTVCGQVVSATHLTRSRGNPTFLNLDKPHPRQIFTILIWGSDRAKFDKPPEQAFKNKDLCVTGRIREYRGKPEIVVHDPKQIELDKRPTGKE